MHGKRGSSADGSGDRGARGAPARGGEPGAALRAWRWALGRSTHRMRLGRLRAVHRGVYTIGHRLLTQDGRWMAAVLACGPRRGAESSRGRGALGHARRHVGGGDRAKRATRTGRDPGPSRRAPGGRAHDAPRNTDHDGAQNTPRPQCCRSTRTKLRSALRRAEQLRLTDPLSLHDLIARYPRRPGLKAIKALLDEASIGARIIRSELEERFQDFLIRAGLPLPQTNVVIEGYEVDCVWPEQRADRRARRPRDPLAHARLRARPCA